MGSPAKKINKYKFNFPYKPKKVLYIYITNSY